MRELKILREEEIRAALPDRREVIEAVKKGFIAYSAGEAQIPPVGYLGFTDPKGDTHIKYGVINGDDHFTVKIASGFYENPKQGLPSSSGIVLVFSAKTGFPEAVLADNGCLTAMRTAAAGAAAAEALGPKRVEAIGIIGTGEQARLQLLWLQEVTDCRRVYVWGRSRGKAEQYCRDMAALGYHVTAAESVKEVAAHCNLIVTTTSSEKPLLFGSDIRPGTHITAMGTDAPGKQEMDSSVFAHADIAAADSRLQCFDHGDLSYAVKAGTVQPENVCELGEIFADPSKGRTAEEQITVADLTGVAVQDIAIAGVVLKHTGGVE